MAEKQLVNLVPLYKGETYEVVTFNETEYLKVFAGSSNDTGIYSDPETLVEFGDGAEISTKTMAADFTMGATGDVLYGDNGGRYFKATLSYDSDTETLVGVHPNTRRP